MLSRILESPDLFLSASVHGDILRLFTPRQNNSAALHRDWMSAIRCRSFRSTCSPPATRPPTGPSLRASSDIQMGTGYVTRAPRGMTAPAGRRDGGARECRRHGSGSVRVLYMDEGVWWGDIERWVLIPSARALQTAFAFGELLTFGDLSSLPRALSRSTPPHTGDRPPASRLESIGHSGLLPAAGRTPAWPENRPDKSMSPAPGRAFFTRRPVILLGRI